MRRARPWRAASPRHCSSSASSPKRFPGPISTLGRGVTRPSRGGRKAAMRWAFAPSSPLSPAAIRAAESAFRRKSPRLWSRGCNISRPYRFTWALRDTRRSGTAMSEVSLTGWMKALIAYVRSGEPDLTNRQMALLMLVYLTPGPHTVRGLAKVLGVSKPVVTRALNTLGALGYLRRERDQDDRRNVFVVRTSSGAEFLEGFKSNIRGSGDTGEEERPSAERL